MSLPDVAPTVSVVIVVKDGARHIRRQLDALGAQVGAPPFEVVVADNGSRDDTVAVVSAWIDGGIGAPCAARVVDASARPGIPHARNVGALATSGAIIAYCDSDDQVSPTWVAQIQRGLTTPGLVGGRTEAFDVDGRPRPDVSLSGLAGGPRPYSPTCNLAVTRDCFFAVGGFDESLPRYGFEDVDFCWRAQDLGYPLGFLPEAVVRFTVSGQRASVRKVFLLSKGRMAIVRRHPDFDGRHYTLSSCLGDVLVTTLRLPVRLLRKDNPPSRELRWWVGAVGRLVGFWHYEVRGRDREPRLLGSPSDA